jgi:ornithine carbamoyltransferase
MLKDLLRTSDLTPADLDLLLDLSAEAKAIPHGTSRALHGETVIVYFTKPSTRTKLSVTAAITHLGATPVVVGPTELQLGRGETIEDTARVMGAFTRAVVIRTFSDDDVRRLALHSPVPVINALTDGHHPLQSLADLLTLREQFGDLRGRKVAYVGDGNNVAHSLIEACALAGVDIAVATPGGYEPDTDVVAEAREIAKGSSITVTQDPEAAVQDACAVYTDVWLSMGDADDERDARRAALAPYRVDDALMRHAQHDAVFMHCLPAHRGDEVTASVMDGPASVVFQQAANRLPTAQAVLFALVQGKLTGRAVR